MAHITDTELDELRDALDHLWGVLTVDQVIDIRVHAPDVIDTCVQNHQWVSHQLKPT